MDQILHFSYTCTPMDLSLPVTRFWLEEGEVSAQGAHLEEYLWGSLGLWVMSCSNPKPKVMHKKVEKLCILCCSSILETVKQIKDLMADFKNGLRENTKFYSKELFDALFLHPYTTIPYLSKELGIHRNTASVRLKELVALGYLEQRQPGKAHLWSGRCFMLSHSGSTLTPSSDICGVLVLFLWIGLPLIFHIWLFFCKEECLPMLFETSWFFKILFSGANLK